MIIVKSILASQVITIALTAIIAGTGGYYLHAIRSSSPFIAQKNEIPSLDILLVENSFSEIKNSKALLEASAKQLIMGTWNQAHSEKYLDKSQLSNKIDSSIKLESAIRRLEDGIQEYVGTEEKLLITKNLLVLLWENEMLDRWLDLYLQTLNEDSIHQYLSSWANRALECGKKLGREREVVTTFQRFEVLSGNGESSMLSMSSRNHPLEFRRWDKYNDKHKHLSVERNSCFALIPKTGNTRVLQSTDLAQEEKAMP